MTRPVARNADDPDCRVRPAPSHRTHPPAVEVDPGADQPGTPSLPQPDSQRPRGERASVTRGRCSPVVADRRWPRDQAADEPWPGLKWHSSAPQPSTRLRVRRRIRRHNHAEEAEIPARGAPSVDSERVNVGAAHALRHVVPVEHDPPISRRRARLRGRSFTWFTSLRVPSHNGDEQGTRAIRLAQIRPCGPHPARRGPASRRRQRRSW